MAYKTLVQRNREAERTGGRPPDSKTIFLPFIVINTSRETVVDCSIASDKTEFLFHFDQPFEIHDDIEILKRLGLSYGLDKSEVPEECREVIRNCLPPALRNYADEIMDGNLTASLAQPQPPPPQPPKTSLPLNASPIERKVVPLVRAVNPSAVRTIIPSVRPAAPRTAIRPVCFSSLFYF